MIGVVIISWLMANPASAAPPLCPSPQQVVAAALDTSPAALRASAEREVARARLMAERSRRYPQVGAFGQTGLGDRQPLDQFRDDQIGLSANLELTSFGQRKAAVTGARRTLRAAEAGELQAKVDVAQNALLLYIDYREAEQLVALAKRQVSAYTQQRSSVSRRLNQGLVTRGDAGQIETRYQTARAELDEARLARDDALIEAQIFAGITIDCQHMDDERAGPTLGPAIAETLANLDLDQARRLADNRAYGLARARLNARAAEANLRAANRAGLPTISANAFVLEQYDDSEMPVDTRWQRQDRVGFSYRQDIFTGGMLRARQAEERARAKAAKADLNQEEQRTAYLVERSTKALLRYRAILARREAGRNAAADRLEVTELELSRGSKTITDLVFAQDDDFNAAVGHARARAAQERELVRLAAMTGLLGEAFPTIVAP